MLKINFRVDEDVLARVMISKNAMPTEFANYLWDKYRDSYKYLKKRVSSKDIDLGIIEELTKQEFFKKSLSDANGNLVRIKANWGRSLAKIQEFLKNTLKTEFDLNVTAYICPAGLNCGRNLGDNCFVWGNPIGLRDENYDLVYLVHESLHSYFEKGDLTHAVIENIADIELAKFLNKSERGYETHSFTKEEHIKIYPYWNLYLNKSKEDIEKDQLITGFYYNIDAYEKEREAVSKLNINQFVSFLNEN